MSSFSLRAMFSHLTAREEKHCVVCFSSAGMYLVPGMSSYLINGRRRVRPKWALLRSHVKKKEFHCICLMSRLPLLFTGVYQDHGRDIKASMCWKLFFFKEAHILQFTSTESHPHHCDTYPNTYPRRTSVNASVTLTGCRRRRPCVNFPHVKSGSAPNKGLFLFTWKRTQR